MQTNIQNIENLLSQTTTITNSYKRVEKATGENFNIFSVLGIEHYEESTHSRFIAELLNFNGRHGFDNLFLIKFLDLLGIDNNFFDVNNYRVETEFFIGNLTETTGGRIDILLTDNQGSQVMIENKIYAAEQPNQLLRYYNYNPNAKLLYLTLFGSDSQQDFEEENKEKEKIYTTVSYTEFIIQWLEECQKIAVENPIVRETIRQYKNLVKKLTYQNINEKMNQEILSAIVGEGKKQNFESLISLVNLTNDIYKVAVNEHLYPTLDKLIEKNNLTAKFNREKILNKDAAEWALGFSIQSEKMSKQNLQIGFAFNTKRGANSLIIGFGYINQEIKKDFDYTKLIQNYENCFSGKREETNGWPAFQYFNGYRNWENLNDLKEVIHGNFKNDFYQKIETLLKIVDESF